MALKSLQLLLLTLLSITLLLNPSVASLDMSGKWHPISNVDDPLIVELAMFAVSTYNGKHMADLTYEKVIKGEYRIGDGTDYNMRIYVTSSTNSSSSGVYAAFVYDNPVLQYRDLNGFDKES